MNTSDNSRLHPNRMVLIGPVAAAVVAPPAAVVAAAAAPLVPALLLPELLLPELLLHAERMTAAIDAMAMRTSVLGRLLDRDIC
jgi:hypothetical protein